MSMLNLNLTYQTPPSSGQIFCSNVADRWFAWLRKPHPRIDAILGRPAPMAHEIRHKICERAQEEIEQEKNNV